jgi:hypothetical protein
MMIPKIALMNFRTETLIDLFKYYAKQSTLAHELYNFTYDESIFDEHYEAIESILDDLRDILIHDRKEEYEAIMLSASVNERV